MYDTYDTYYYGVPILLSDASDVNNKMNII